MGVIFDVTRIKMIVPQKNFRSVHPIGIISWFITMAHTTTKRKRQFLNGKASALAHSNRKQYVAVDAKRLTTLNTLNVKYKYCAVMLNNLNALLF